MVADGMTFEKHAKDRSNTLSQCRCVGIKCAMCNTQRKNVRMRAYGEVLSVHLCLNITNADLCTDVIGTKWTHDQPDFSHFCSFFTFFIFHFSEKTKFLLFFFLVYLSIMFYCWH